MVNRIMDYDFPGDRRDFEAYQEAGQSDEESLDSAVDQFTEHFLQAGKRFADRNAPGNEIAGASFEKALATIARTAITVESISGLIFAFLTDQIRIIKITTVRAMLLLLKDSKPRLNLDVVEHVFGLAKCKETEIASKHGVTRATVSKRVTAMRREFNVELPRQKQVASIYRESRLSKYQNIREKLTSIRNARPTISVAA